MQFTPWDNPMGTDGFEFVEYAAPDPAALGSLFEQLGFSAIARHRHKAVTLYRQGEVNFIINAEPDSFAQRFARLHGPSVCAMAFRVDDANQAYSRALELGAWGFDNRTGPMELNIPAIKGIGDSLIYFVDAQDTWTTLGFVPLEKPDRVAGKGFLRIDHLTNNVPRGELQRWGAFYKDVFAFTEVRYFDIRGVKTGLQSYALRSPCGTFCIPINEGTESGSQIDEYLEEYKGPGIQHLAFTTDDILASLRALEGTPIQFLDIDDDYYASVFDRVPGVREDHAEIARRNVLVDGDADGYLLQIFTKNLIGPIFIELIQRRNHLSFGEGNFGALFRSIERDQQRRGYLT